MNRPDDASSTTAVPRFSVRRITVDDADAFAQMLSNPEVYPHLLQIYTDNDKARTLYERFGFVEEGVHRCQALRDGVYVDTLSMARLNPAPLRGFPRD